MIELKTNMSELKIFYKYSGNESWYKESFTNLSLEQMNYIINRFEDEYRKNEYVALHIVKDMGCSVLTF